MSKQIVVKKSRTHKEESPSSKPIDFQKELHIRELAQLLRASDPAFVCVLLLKVQEHSGIMIARKEQGVG